MKHTPEELILANAVMRRAFDLRSQAIGGMPEAEQAAFLERPMNDLIIQALEEIERVAAVIAKARPPG